MADENYVIQVSDDGTINELVALLQLLGLTGDEASDRLASGFTNMSRSQDVATASAKAFGAAANASFGDTASLGDALDKLTTSEQKAATTLDGLARLTSLLATAERDGYTAAIQQAEGLDAVAVSGERVIASLAAQGQAVEGLSRYQQTLLARQAELDNAYTVQIASSNTYTTALSSQQAALSRTATSYTDAIAELNAYERATVAANISVQGLYGTYAAGDTLFGAQAAEAAGAARELAALGIAADAAAGSFSVLDKASAASAANAAGEAASFSAAANAATERLAANAALAGSEGELASAEARAASSIQEFIALQRECNTTTIVGRDAIASAATAYNTAVNAIGAYKVELEILSSDQGKLADSALKMADGLRAAASAALALESAEAAAIGETSALGAAMTEIGVIGKELGQTFGGLNAIFAGAFALKEIVSADDAFVKINASLATVTHSAADLNNTYNQLHTASNITQTDISANAKLYVQLADATKGSSIAGGDLVKAVAGIDTALKLGNVTGQDATRVLRSLGEIFNSTGGSAERFIQNLRRESTPVYAALAQSAKELGINIDEFGSTSENASSRVSKLTERLKEQEASAGSTLKSVSSYSDAIKTSSAESTKAQAAYNALTAQIGPTGVASNALATALNTQYAAIVKADVALANAKNGYAAAKNALNDKTAASISATKAELALAESSANVGQKQKDLIAIFENIYLTSGEASQQFSTVSGTLTVLKNNLIDFAGHADSASFAIGALKDVILIAANNLHIIIPAVLLFAAGIAVVKVANLIGDLVSLARALFTAGAAFVVANIEVLAVVGTLALLAIAVTALYNQFAPANAQIDIFGSIMSGVTKVAGVLGDSVGVLTKNITDHAIHVQAGTDAHKLFAAGVNGSSTATTGLSGSLDVNSAANTAALNATNGNSAGQVRFAAAARTSSDAATTLAATTRDASTAIDGNTAKLDDNRAKTDAAAASQGKLNTAVGASPSLWNTLADAIQGVITKLANYISSAATAAASAVKNLVSGGTNTTSQSGIGHARDGGTFTVAGGTGVDSKHIAVSPGEVVTVQTPAQYRAGVRPAADPAQTHFATGGVTTGAGVDLGSGVSLGSGDPAGATGSVTGFSDGRSSDVGALIVATNDATVTTTANTVAANDNTSGLQTTSDAITTLVDALNNLSAKISGGSVSSAASVPSTPATSSVDTTSATTASSSTVSSASRVSNGKVDTSAAASLKNLDGGHVISGGNAIGADGTLYIAEYAPSRFGQGPLIGYRDGYGNLVSDGGGGSSVSGGTSASSGDIGGYQLGSFGGTTTASTVSSTSTKPTGQYQLVAVAAGDDLVGTARDGADFYVPGGTGVDSKVMQVAVSPGESVHVRTPSQQTVAQPTGQSGGTVNMYITTPDANSFGNAQGQLQRKLVQGLRRAGRK